MIQKRTYIFFVAFILEFAVQSTKICFAQHSGDLDRTFNYSRGADYQFSYGNGASGTVYTTSVQSDGKIIIGGLFTFYNGTARNCIARLNTDGSLDATFNIGTGANSCVNSTSVQADGKIIIGGYFTSYNGTSRNRIARLNADGNLDVTFNPGTGANSCVNSTSVQADGKIIIGGVFTAFNGKFSNRIARLNHNGSLDNTFNPGTGANNWIYATALQADSKILIGGVFSSYNRFAKNCIARLNVDGSLDSNFNLGTGANGVIRSIALQTDGKIIIGGSFSSYNGTEQNHIARLNTNGSLDTSFNYKTEVQSISMVHSISLQQNENIIIAGEVMENSYTYSNNNIIRLYGSTSCTIPSNPTIAIIGPATICSCDSIVLTSSSITGNLWNTGETTQSITVSKAGIYSVQALFDTCKSDKSCIIQINATDCGAVFSDSGTFNTASNWSNNTIPLSGSNVIVSGKMTVNSNPHYNNIIVKKGGVIDINVGDTLSVTGNLTNLGTITGEGMVRLAGANNQEFGGGIIANLVLDNAATIIQNAVTIIRGSLSLGINQVLDLNNGALIMRPTATQVKIPKGSRMINAANFRVEHFSTNKALKIKKRKK